MSATSQLQVNRALALRYLGCRGTPDTMTQQLIERAALTVEAAAEPRWVTMSAPLVREDGALFVQGTILHLTGLDIARHLQGASRCILLCATLGMSIERLLRTESLRDLSFAAALDACASSAIEVLCDALQTELANEQSTHFLTDRFSPGYGDLPLTLQREFCAVLDTSRRIGVSVSQSGILIPRKTVTAIIGISDAPVQKRTDCAACSQVNTCPFRKEGTHCAAF